MDLLTKPGGNAGSFPWREGTAVVALRNRGITSRVKRQAEFRTAALLPLPTRQNSVKVTIASLTTANIVLATIQNPQSGVFIEGAQPSLGSFTITLSKKPPAPVHVGWFVIG